MRAIKFLESKRVYLRPLQESDAIILSPMVNQPTIQEKILQNKPVSIEQEKKRIQGSVGLNGVSLGLCLQSNDELIGTMGRHNHDMVNRTAETGAMIGFSSNQKQGYGTEGKMLILKHLFDTLNVRKVYSHLVEYNKQSLKYSTSIGYVCEATLSQKIFKKGKYWDEYILSITKESWLPYYHEYYDKYLKENK